MLEGTWGSENVVVAGRDQQKARECGHLQRFREAAPEILPSVEPLETEKPDFLFELESGRTIGLEVTEYVRAERHAGLEIRGRILARAKQLYEARSLPPIRVGIDFHRGFYPKKAAADRLARQLVEVVVRIVPEAEGGRLVEEDPRIEGVSGVRTSRITGLIASIWSSADASYIPTLGPESIQARIDDKEPRLDEYQRRCSEVWLLIVADGLATSVMAGLSPEARSAAYVTRFRRVLFFENYEGWWHEFTVEARYWASA